MTTDQALEAIAQTFETFDRRLSSIEERSVTIESNMAEAARATEEVAKSIAKLTELYLSISEGLEQIKGLLGNYVDETKRLRQSSNNLIAEMRDRLRAP